MQKHVNLVDLVKSFPTNIYLQNLASIQKRTSPVKFAHLAEKSGKGSIPNLSTKVSRCRTGGEQIGFAGAGIHQQVLVSPDHRHPDSFVDAEKEACAVPQFEADAGSLGFPPRELAHCRDHHTLPVEERVR